MMCGGRPRSSASCLRSRTRLSNSTSSQAISPARCALGSGALTGRVSRHRLALLERRQALGRQLQHAELLRRLPQVAEPDQLAPDGAPFRPAVLLADAVGGELLVAPPADLLGVRARQHLDDLVEPNAKPVRSPDAVDARQKLLRRQRAVEGLAG